MFNTKELAYLESEIIALRKKIIDAITKLNDFHMEYPEFQGTEYEEEEIIFLTEKLYHHVLVYFEAKGMDLYRNKFEEEFKDLIKDRSKILEVEFISDFDYWDLKMISAISKYLRSFLKLQEKESVLVDSFESLKSVLESTSEILSLTKTKVTNEASIYTPVRAILELYHDTRKVPSSFRGKFKEYKPDILVPDISTAVEYKLVGNESNVDDYLDEIVVDARNYVNDPHYSRFVAVICIQSKTLTNASIHKAWKLKAFPENWHLVIVRIH